MLVVALPGRNTAANGVRHMPKTIRQIRVEGNIAFVPLTQGYEAIIDAADVPLVEGWNWCAIVSPHTAYASRSTKVDGTTVHILMHKTIMGVTTMIDHKNGHGWDNRRDNLRPATYAQNNRNQRLAKNNTCGLKGASFHKASQSWRAQIKLDGKKIHLGLFATAADAHAAYCRASAKLHGEFGKTA
jgi:hypothetical protein